jgi:NADPH2:quinone reductase
MKAIVIHHYGPPEVLKYESVPDPEPRAGEIRIRIHAATVNRVLDVSLRAGNERARGPVLPLIPGVDCAGVVDALGAGVTRWQPGMRVAAAGVMPLDICPEDHKDYAGPTGMMGIKRPGGFAEMVAVPACAAIELPINSTSTTPPSSCATCRPPGTCSSTSPGSKPARPC